jgi:hypothetical protein
VTTDTNGRARLPRLKKIRADAAVLVLAIALVGTGIFGLGGTASAQVPSANPARAWIPSPRVTVGDLWREVRSGGMAVIASATSQDQPGRQTIVTVFQGGGRLFRCLEWISIQDGIDQQALCTTVR